MMGDVKSVILAGVGGQGTILVSRVLTRGLQDAGYDVKMSEVHGMAQRGGSVSTQVRYGEKVWSPLVGRGQADVLVAFEKMEALRYAEYLRIGGTAIVNDHEILPLTVATGAAAYPQGILEEMARRFRTVVVPAARIAEGLGNARCQNIVLFGASVRALGLEGIDWRAALERTLPPKLLPLNLRAFDAGLAAAAAVGGCDG